MTAGVDPMSAPMFCARIAVISAAVVAFVPMCGDSTAAFAVVNGMTDPPPLPFGMNV
jgi:hypothetical protein